MLSAVLLAAATTTASPIDFHYRRFTVPEGILTSSMLVGTGAIIVFNHERAPAWRGGFFVDDPVRHELRGRDIDTRRRAAFIGDMTYYGALAYPYLVDVIAVAWIGHGNSSTAAQMALINTEAFALTGFLSFLSNALIRRERPYARECTEEDKETFPDCRLPGKSESFFSGHTGIAATAAGLTCSHHAHLPLYGGGAGDVLACVATIGGALATGYTRLVADKHYLFDVATGLGLGFPIGYLLAEYHYRQPIKATGSSFIVRPVPMVSSTMAGAAATGVF